MRGEIAASASILRSSLWRESITSIMKETCELEANVMVEFSVQTINVKVVQESGEYEDSPGQNLDRETGYYDSIIHFSHQSGWLAHFAVVNFPQAEKLMGRFVWWGEVSPAPLDKLNTSGNMEIKVVGDRWISPIRAMKQGTSKPYPTLHQATIEELDTLVGQSFEDFLSQFGHYRIGRYGDMNPGAGNNLKNGRGLESPAGNVGLIAALIAVTRPVALVKQLSA
jgi:hypothetical protein